MIREIIAAIACLVVPPQHREVRNSVMVMQHGYVMDVADNKVKTMNSQIQWFRVEKIWSRFTSSLTSALTVNTLNRISMRFEEDIIFFKGIEQEIQDQDLDVTEWADNIIPRLDSLKNSLLKSRLGMMSLFENGDKNIQKAKERVVVSMADLFESMEKFKWTIKELQADRSVIDQGYQANTLEELDKLFDRIS